ncbi:glycosyltransferase [Aquimarina sp. W85]|uniref:glycosyltransferase n=1 Tax=Aquimarina rhodophyticola TaxID=3342246 RepID=UPI00366C099F
MTVSKKKILIIGSVWPEPDSSAAGTRMMQLIQVFFDADCKITFACTSNMSNHMADLNTFGIDKYQIAVNDSNFDTFLIQLKPDIVIFDRFIIEEQFGWRVSKTVPNALRILNTEDLHSLRKTREHCFKSKNEFTPSILLEEAITKREIASIYRCDLSLIISEYELSLLKKTFSIDHNLLLYLPITFNYETLEQVKNTPSFSERKNFITIGNFRHEPNWQSVLYLKKNIWPLIAAKNSEAELHIYGAYPPPKAIQLNNPKERFYIKGWTTNAHKVMKEARVCLAPIQFGAGIKGKLLQAMIAGTPNVTTAIGAEGMHASNVWSGFISDTPKDFAEKASLLYTNETIWNDKKKIGNIILNERFNSNKFQNVLLEKIEYTLRNLRTIRNQNFIGSMLSYHTIRSTEYMSRWIELKNKHPQTD